MERLTKDKVEKVCQLALEDAHKRAEDAGYSGAMSDGGATVIREYVEIWRAGLAGKVPKALEEYYDKAVRMEDPEWKEYQRLKTKFRGK